MADLVTPCCLMLLRCAFDDSPLASQLGVFQGNSPFDLLALEQLQPAVDGPASWPVANPVLEAGDFLGSLANPFLFPKADGLYVFYEEALCSNSGKQSTSIRAAESKDGGVTWQPLGPVLNQEGSLSKPFLFEHENQVSTRFFAFGTYKV